MNLVGTNENSPNKKGNYAFKLIFSRKVFIESQIQFHVEIFRSCSLLYTLNEHLIFTVDSCMVAFCQRDQNETRHSPSSGYTTTAQLLTFLLQRSTSLSSTHTTQLLFQRIRVIRKVE